MKKLIPFLILVASIGQLKAQKCNAVFFSQDGQKFQVVVNGVLQNLDYGTNVKVADLSFEGNYKVAVNFSDNTIPSLNKAVYMTENNTEYSFEIKKNKKGEYVMRMSNAVPIAQAPAAAPSQSVVTYSTVAPVAAPAATSTVTQTVSTTSTTVGSNAAVNSGTQENVSMNVSVGGVGMNVNVNVNDGGMNTDANTTTTYSETTTVTTSSSTSYNEEAAAAPPTVDHYVMPGYSGPIGCTYPMSDSDFNSAKQSIETKDFSDSKLTLAKQITKSNCLTAEQAKQITLLFDYENTKLEYAKFAYDHTFDLGNYFKVNDAFEFEATIQDLNKYIEGK